jgi:hypothetical protein
MDAIINIMILKMFVFQVLYVLMLDAFCAVIMLIGYIPSCLKEHTILIISCYPLNVLNVLMFCTCAVITFIVYTLLCYNIHNNFNNSISLLFGFLMFGWFVLVHWS